MRRVAVLLLAFLALHSHVVSAATVDELARTPSAERRIDGTVEAVVDEFGRILGHTGTDDDCDYVDPFGFVPRDGLTPWNPFEVVRQDGDAVQRLYLYVCEGEDGSPGTGTGVWVETVTPEDIARQARDRLRFPALEPAMLPTEASIVGYATWLAVGTPWEPVRAQAELGGVTSTVVATPELAVWEMGDGTVVECLDGGRLFDPATDDPEQPPCGHTYTRSSLGAGNGNRYPVAASVSWKIGWSSNVGDDVPDWDTETTSVTLLRSVAEVQTLNTAG